MSQRAHYSHSLKQGREEKIVGAFVVLALLIVVTLFVINSRNLYLFENTVNIELESESAQGIARDTPIRAAGMEIGRVSSVELTEQHRFLIHARIYERYFDLLRSDSQASIGSLSVLGRSSIDISVGSPQLAGLSEGERLRIQPTASIDELMAMAGPLVENVGDALAQMNALLKSVEPAQVQSTLAHTEQLLVQANSMMAALGQEGTVLHWLIHDEQLASQLASNLDELEQLLAASHTRLGYIDDTMPRVHGALDSVQGVSQQSQIILADLPALLEEVRALTEQSQLLMEQASRTWPLSRSRQVPAPQLLEGGAYE